MSESEQIAESSESVVGRANVIYDVDLLYDLCIEIKVSSTVRDDECINDYTPSAICWPYQGSAVNFT